MVKCNVCKSKHDIKIKGSLLNSFLCDICKNKNINYSSRLKAIKENNSFIKDSNDRIRQEQHLKELNENITFNCWIIQERQAEKKFLMQQNNKDFLADQFKKDLNDIMNEE